MKYELTDVSNIESKEHKHIGEVNEFSFNGDYFTFGTIRSSRVFLIKSYKQFLEVVTKNSVYTFTQISN